VVQHGCVRQPDEQRRRQAAEGDHLTVRRQTVSDVPAVSGVRARSWRAAYTGLVPGDYLDSIEPTAATVARAEWRFEELGDRVHAFVADLGGAIGGFVYAGPDRDVGPRGGEIWAIYVDPAHWGTGIGRVLLTTAVDVLRDDLAPPRIVVWVLEDNVAARGFYEHFGFVPTGARRYIDLGRRLPEVQYVLAPAASPGDGG
jgi:RimJ/RimL family protein N-acetyltransferase